MPSRLTTFAKQLRSDSTDVERLLWRYLRAHRLADVKFRRQVPIGPYIADFVCFEARLVVELDGGQHADAMEQDACRDAWLSGQGFRVLRFWNNEVLDNLDGVLTKILEELSVSPSPQPLSHEGRGALIQQAPAITALAPSPLMGEGWGEGDDKQKYQAT